MSVPQRNIDVFMNAVEEALKALIKKNESISNLLDSAELCSINIVFDRNHEASQSVYEALTREKLNLTINEHKGCITEVMNYRLCAADAS